jgi:hypothetical protein
MKALFLSAITTATFLSVAPWASAAYMMDGNALYSECSVPIGNEEFTACLGYLDGIADAMAVNPVNGFSACIPAGVENNQLRDVVTKFLWTKAAYRQYPAAGLVAAAFAGSFPCQPISK